ncbi:unnamed protein product [Parnassius apollo]|uniref:(apollo) hypothetical protein n=1 Tax=Parnassius apollo TaxID=110799 RepID=A0A8S3W627_PARAO|nr:unnamed protein product [Parnassius apollo]
MVGSWRALALLSVLQVCAGAPEAMYHNQFAVHVPAGEKHGDDIAKRHGFVNHGQCRREHEFSVRESRQKHEAAEKKCGPFLWAVPEYR